MRPAPTPWSSPRRRYQSWLRSTVHLELESRACCFQLVLVPQAGSLARSVTAGQLLSSSRRAACGRACAACSDPLGFLCRRSQSCLSLTGAGVSGPDAPPRTRSSSWQPGPIGHGWPITISFSSCGVRTGLCCSLRPLGALSAGASRAASCKLWHFGKGVSGPLLLQTQTRSSSRQPGPIGHGSPITFSFTTCSMRTGLCGPRPPGALHAGASKAGSCQLWHLERESRALMLQTSTHPPYASRLA